MVHGRRRVGVVSCSRTNGILCVRGAGATRAAADGEAAVVEGGHGARASAVHSSPLHRLGLIGGGAGAAAVVLERGASLGDGAGGQR